MKNIVLEVDEALATAWNNSSPELKAEYAVKLTTVLKEMQTTETELTEEQLAIIAEDSKGEPYEWWNDEEMVTELDQIAADMESGKDKGVHWENVKEDLLNQLRKM